MVSSLAAIVLIMMLTGQTLAEAPDSFGLALEHENYPWFDGKADKVRPILPWPDLGVGWIKSVGDWSARRYEAMKEWFKWLNSCRMPFNLAGLGDLIAIGLVMLVLTVVLVGLLELLRRYRPVSEDLRAAAGPIRPGSAQRIEGMPAGVGMDASDPWVEAVKRRQRGDYSGAVIYLFAHQLLTLDRLEKIQISPGKTGRQLVRSVRDRAWRDPVEPTLRLFETVYYGHQNVTAAAFEEVWTLAESFERRAAGKVAA